MLVDAMERDDEIQRQMGLPNPMVPMRLKPVGRAGSEPGGIQTRRDPNPAGSDRGGSGIRTHRVPIAGTIRHAPVLVPWDPRYDPAHSWLGSHPMPPDPSCRWRL